MSWQSYVENQICNQVSCRYAAIASLNDGSTWGKYEKDVDAAPTPQAFPWGLPHPYIVAPQQPMPEPNMEYIMAHMSHLQMMEQQAAAPAYFPVGTSPKINQQQLKAIADAMRANPDTLIENGIRLGQEKYICLYADNSLVRGRLGGSALCIVATKKCLIVAATVDSFPPGKLNNVVEKLGDYLRSIDY